VTGGVTIAVAGTLAMGVAEGVAMGATEVVAGEAAGSVAGGVVGGVAGEVTEAGTENNSKSLTKIGIAVTRDSVACGWAMLRVIPKVEERTYKRKIRMAQMDIPCRAGKKNMRGSSGRLTSSIREAPGENK
jgi:hypothetical protein